MNGKYDEAIEEFEKYLTKGTDEVKARTGTGGDRWRQIRQNRSRTAHADDFQRGQKRQLFLFRVFGRTGAGRREDVLRQLQRRGSDRRRQKKYRLFRQDIYVSDRTEDGWGGRGPRRSQINRPEYHNSNVTLSPDGRRMFFTRQLLQGNVVSESKIYFERKSNPADGARPMKWRA
jgi:hypothetical protein